MDWWSLSPTPMKWGMGEALLCLAWVGMSETTKGFDPLKGLAVIAYFER